MRLIFASSHIGLVNFLIPLSMLDYTLWLQLGAHLTLEKNEQRTQGFWAILLG